MNAETTSGVSQHIISDLKNLCRLCGTNDLKLVDIYSEEGLQNDIPNKIKLYIPVQLLESEEVSVDCCLGCISTILSWHEFVQKAMETAGRYKSFNRKLEAISQDLEINQNQDVRIPASPSLYDSPNAKTDIFEDCTSENSLKFQCGENEDNKRGMENYVDILPAYDDINNGDKMQTMNGQEQEPRIEEIKYACHICTEIFSSEDEVLNHTGLTHPDVTDNEESPNKNSSKRKWKRSKIDPKVINEAKVLVDNRVYYNCKECGKSLLSPYTYVRHMRIHTGERPFVCDLCGKQFRVSQGLVRHLKETHEKIKNFSCDLCGRMFATKRNVDEHRRIHTNERPYICALCGKTFKQKASLFVHNRSHSNTFPYKCESCYLGFHIKSALMVHVTKHTGQKPYPCDVCGRCFRIKYELKRHRLVHSEDKPFSCSLCGLCFKQKRYLRNHFKANHVNN